MSNEKILCFVILYLIYLFTKLYKNFCVVFERGYGAKFPLHQYLKQFLDRPGNILEFYFDCCKEELCFYFVVENHDCFSLLLSLITMAFYYTVHLQLTREEPNTSCVS